MKKATLVLSNRRSKTSQNGERTAYSGGMVRFHAPPADNAIVNMSEDDQEIMYALMLSLKIALNAVHGLERHHERPAGHYEIFLREPRDIGGLWSCVSNIRIVWTSSIRGKHETITQPYWSGRGIVVADLSGFHDVVTLEIHGPVSSSKWELLERNVMYFMRLLRVTYLNWEDKNPGLLGSDDRADIFRHLATEIENELPYIIATVQEKFEDELDDEREREMYMEEYTYEVMDDMDMSVFENGDGSRV